ncbi:MAG: PocR ligand-binding domain-containing protein [Lentisphaeria bacterium]|nr:PocR ligand-binding domain-containing protein [Lentisphaeria bacterium]
MDISSSKSSLGIVLLPEIQEILDNFASLLKIRVVFFGTAGEILLRGRGEGNCRYCRFVQEQFGLERCVALDRMKLSQAAEGGESISYQCHGGLCETVMPLRVSDRLLGYVMFGQFRRKGDKPALKGTAETRAFRQCPVFTPETMKSLTGMLAMLVDYLVRHELVRRDGDYLLGELKDYIDRHHGEEMRIEDVARYLGRSVSSLSHYLQKNGCRFRELLIERRIRHVEEGLRNGTSRSIKELALEAGFNDPCYFSRIYQRRRKRTITEFRSGLEK